MSEQTQVALATGQQREQCVTCLNWPHWEIPNNGIGIVCTICGTWYLVTA